MSKSMLPSSVYDALNDHSVHVGDIGIKLKSLGLLLIGQNKDALEQEELLSGVGIILTDLSDDLERLADQLDPVEIIKFSKGEVK